MFKLFLPDLPISIAGKTLVSVILLGAQVPGQIVQQVAEFCANQETCEGRWEAISETTSGVE